MKKILAIILVFMLAFSTLLITACNKDNTADTDIETSSTTPEETSSGRKRGEGAGSDTSTPITNSSNAGTPTSSNNDPNNSSAGTPTSSDDDPSNSSADTPTSSDDDDDYNDYSYTASVTNPTEKTSKAGQFDELIYMFAQDFTRPSLDDDFYDTLVSYETMYNALSATDKGLVQNYKFLLEARTAYNGMAKKKCEKLINNLPDATIDNLTDFGTQAKEIEKFLGHLGGDANSIPNKTIYDNKVKAADSLLIDTFNQKVSALQTFEYSSEYKAKLDDAYVIYGLMNASQQSKVASSKQTLDTKNTLYNDTAVVKTFEEKVLTLPDIANLTDTNKADVLNLKTAYSQLTKEQQGLISQEAMTKYSELEKWFVGGRIAYVFHDVYAQCGESSWVKRGWIAKNVYSDFVIEGSSLSYNGSCDVDCFFEGKNYSGMGVDKMKNSTITIQPKAATVFVIACNLKSEKKTCTITVTKNGTAMPELTTDLKYSPDGKNCEYRFNLTEAGTYVFSLTNCNDSVRVVALAMY